MIKLGFQSSKYDNLNLEEEIQFSQSSDIDFFDVFFDGFGPEDVLNVELPSIITVHAPYGFGRLSKEFQQPYFDYVNSKGAKVFTLNFIDLTLDVVEHICKNIKEAAICIENNIPDRNEFTDETYLDFIVKAHDMTVEKGLKIYAALDVGHAKVNGYEPLEVAKQLNSKGIEIVGLHLHDNDGHEDQHRPAGSIYNGINFDELLSFFNKQKYDVYGAIEHWNNNYNALEYLRNLQN